MKLISIKLPNNRFRGLNKGFEIFFSAGSSENISTFYLTGQNGSGKSNLLELISEIFYYLDSLELAYGSKSLHKAKSFAFEIEYKLQVYAKDVGGGFSFSNFIVEENKIPWVHIKIKKVNNKKPEYFLVYTTGKEYKIDFEKFDKYTVGNIKDNILPSKIIGYTSGQNELLSNAFLKMRYHYFNEYINFQKNLNEENRTGTFSDFLSRSRLMFLDYRNNASVLISNFLMNKDEEHNDLMQVFKDLLGIEGVYSFRITIRFNAQTNSDNQESILLSKSLNAFIDKLKRCTPFIIDNRDQLDIHEGYKRTIILDFIVTDETKLAFGTEFDKSKVLFQFFYEMEILNIYAQDEGIRNRVLNASKDLNISDEIPSISPDNLIFEISDVKVLKTGFELPIKYKNLSDGEHQLLQVMGSLSMMKQDNCLFLLDEPGTHLNPAWAIQYYKHIDICKKDHGSSQILLTTHDPLMITALNKDQVIILAFDRNEQRVIVEQLRFEPRSMSVGGILTSEVFKLRTSLGLPTQELLDERRKITSKDTKLSDDERAQLELINSKLKDVEFVDSARDPLYERFKKEWTRQERKEWDTLPALTTDQIEEQKQLVKEIIEKIRREEQL